MTVKVSKNFSKLIALCAAVFAASAFAGISEKNFFQYNASDFVNEQRAQQPWLGAQMISLSVKGGSSVWLSNYINSWFDPKPIPDLNGTTYQMGANQYGYLRKSDLQGVDPGSDYSNLIHWSDGRTKEITFFDNNIPANTNSTTAYYLDYFGEDDEIYFVMTLLPKDGGEVVDSFQYVNDATKGTEMYNPDTMLVSRLDNTKDLAGNVRINFGLDMDNNSAREFVAFGSAGDYDGNTRPPSGQPLPGAMVAGCLSLGTLLLGKRVRRRK